MRAIYYSWLTLKNSIVDFLFCILNGDRENIENFIKNKKNLINNENNID